MGGWFLIDFSVNWAGIECRSSFGEKESDILQDKEFRYGWVQILYLGIPWTVVLNWKNWENFYNIAIKCTKNIWIHFGGRGDSVLEGWSGLGFGSMGRVHLQLEKLDWNLLSMFFILYKKKMKPQLYLKMKEHHLSPKY